MRSALPALLIVAVIAIGGIAWLLSSEPDPRLAPELTPAANGSGEMVPADQLGDPVGDSGEGAADSNDRAEVAEGSSGEEGADESVDHGAVRGLVVGPGGAAVVGARVFVLDRRWVRVEEFVDPRATPKSAQKGRQGLTGADGTFRVGAPSANKTLRVVALSDRHLPRVVEVPATAGTETDVGEIRLELGVPLSGRVVDQAGAPVEGAKVMTKGGEDAFALAFSRREHGAETDVDGVFQLVLDTAGSFELIARHEEYVDGSYRGNAVGRGQEIDGVLIRLAAGAEIVGRMVGQASGPAGEFEVRARKVEDEKGEDDANQMLKLALRTRMGTARHVASVEEDGTFRLRGLEIGQNYEVAALPSKGSQWSKNEVTETVTVASGARNVVLRYRPGVRVRFTLSDATTGEAIDKVRVTAKLTAEGGSTMRIFGPSGSTENLEADDGGVFVATVRPKENDRTLALEFLTKGYRKLKRGDISIPTEGEIDLGAIELDPAPMLHVTVLDPEGRPVEGARVSTQVERFRAAASPGRSVELARSNQNSAEREARQNARTDKEGVAELSLVAVKGLVVRVRHSDFAAYVGEPFEMPARGHVERTVQLIEGGTLLVRVVDPRGVAQGNIQVNRRAVGQDGFETQSDFGASDTDAVNTDATGVARFLHVRPGLHEVGAGASGRRRGRVGFGSLIPDRQEQQVDPNVKKVDVIDGETSEVEVMREFRSVVVGTITQNGQPLPDATLKILPQGAALPGTAGPFSVFSGAGSDGTTDSLGRFEIEDVELGESVLQIVHRDRVMPTKVEFSAVEGETKLDVALSVSVVKGRVLDGAGNGVAGARVAVEPADKPVKGSKMAGDATYVLFGGGRSAKSEFKTAADGSFEVKGVVAGVPLKVVVRPERHGVGVSEPFEVAEGATHAGVEILVAAAGSLEVSIEGVATPFAFVQLVREVEGGENETQASAANGGKATFHGLAPGEWKLTCNVPGEDEPLKRKVNVVANETVKVVVRK